MGTPLNAIAFISGHIKLKQMKAGFVINLVAIVLITLFCWSLLPELIRKIIKYVFLHANAVAASGIFLTRQE